MDAFRGFDSKMLAPIHRMLLIALVLGLATGWINAAEAVDTVEAMPTVVGAGDAGTTRAAAPVEAPPRNPKYAKAEREPLRMGAREAERPAAPTAPDLMGTVQRLVFWVVILALLGAVAVVAVKSFLPGGRKLFANPAVEILGRTYLDSRRYLALVRVGRRVLVLGVGPEGVEPVSDITEPDEVADLLRQAQPKTPAGVSFFQSLLQGKLRGDSRPGGGARDEGAAGESARLAEAMNGIEEQIKRLRNRD